MVEYFKISGVGNWYSSTWVYMKTIWWQDDGFNSKHAVYEINDCGKPSRYLEICIKISSKRS